MYNIKVIDFNKSYSRLNYNQKLAADKIDGPVMVIAGPGTGKTELLAVRVANILHKTDISPSNILCLTFTDNAARNMTERIASIIGQPAYHVAVRTFHSFGTDIINQYPDFFTDRRLIQPIDELGQYEILRSIFEKLPHSNPLSVKVGEDYIYIKDASKIISWLKHNAITPFQLRQLLDKNIIFYKEYSEDFKNIFSEVPTAKNIQNYQKLLNKISKLSQTRDSTGFLDYASMCAESLSEAIGAINITKRAAPSITSWRKYWLKKDKYGHYRLKDSSINHRKMTAMGEIYDKFQEEISSRGLYDFDDMIMEVVKTLEQHNEVRLNLQEQYQYVLVDEFQDTNKAQLRILRALGDNPIHEGRPNIMAVGDPNQAIYAFQGANMSNVSQFINDYKGVAIINLVNNYRSNQSILDVSSSLLEYNASYTDNMSSPYEEKLKSFVRHSKNLIEHNVLTSELQQYKWIAEKISMLVKNETKPSEIAIIAPKHKYLEKIVPYLVRNNIPVAYERREDVLDAPIIRQLLTMSKLVNAISNQSQEEIDNLIGEVLSYEFLHIPAEDIMLASVECYKNNQHWSTYLLKCKNKKITEVFKWFLEISRSAKTQPLEYILDKLTGSLEQSNNKEFESPFAAYYFNNDELENNTDRYLTFLGQLSSLRRGLREWKPGTTLFLMDLIEFVNLHKQAGIKIVDYNPHTQTTDAVQIMTAYKAKGLEFDNVFVINAQDEVWGHTAKTKNTSIKLPFNLPIKPIGDSDADKLKLFFVSLTRARHSLYISSYEYDQNSKKSLGLSFIGGNNKDSEAPHKFLIPKTIEYADNLEAVQILSTDWSYRYRQIIAKKPALFEPILTDYKLSATHMNNFLDIINAGPSYYLLHNLLRFPSAMSYSASYGDAIHKTLQFVYYNLNNDKLPPISKIIRYFNDTLANKQLTKTEFSKLRRRGETALNKFISSRKNSFSANHIIERNFANQGVILNNARISGKIDKIIKQDHAQMTVVDFKTGNPSSSWNGKNDYEKLKLHKYKHQLMFYKILVERSASFGGKYIVNKGALEFIEPDLDGNIIPILELSYDKDEMLKFEELIQCVWQKITNLDFPDISKYPKKFNGVLEFEKDLLKSKS